MKKIISLSVALVAALSVNVASADSAKLVNPVNGHSYKRFDTAKYWTQAKTACVNLGAHLATITDQAEQDWIVSKQLYSSSVAVFLGGTDSAVEGTWTWITGEPFVYSNWYPGRPDDYSAGQDYLWLYSDGTWDDGGLPSPDYQSSYLCEWEAVNIYSQVLGLTDINHNGATDYALLGEKGTNFTLSVYDGSSQTLISQATVKPKAGYAVKSFTVANDVNGDGVAEIAVLVVKAGNISTLQLHDPITGAIVSTLSLPKN
jgi:Lectin C-type domain